MNLKKTLTICIALTVLIWSVLYAIAAIGHAQILLHPPQDIGFGPHVEPWSQVILMGARGLIGVVLAAFLFAPSTHKSSWLIATLISLVAINLFNLREILYWVPDAKYHSVSVFAFFSPVFLIEYAAHFIGLVIAFILLIFQSRRTRRHAS